jgi:hypothetical protein
MRWAKYGPHRGYLDGTLSTLRERLRRLARDEGGGSRCEAWGSHKRAVAGLRGDEGGGRHADGGSVASGWG